MDEYNLFLGCSDGVFMWRIIKVVEWILSKLMPMKFSRFSKVSKVAIEASLLIKLNVLFDVTLALLFSLIKFTAFTILAPIFASCRFYASTKNWSKETKNILFDRIFTWRICKLLVLSLVNWKLSSQCLITTLVIAKQLVYILFVSLRLCLVLFVVFILWYRTFIICISDGVFYVYY